MFKVGRLVNAEHIGSTDIRKQNEAHCEKAKQSTGNIEKLWNRHLPIRHVFFLIFRSYSC